MQLSFPGSDGLARDKEGGETAQQTDLPVGHYLPAVVISYPPEADGVSLRHPEHFRGGLCQLHQRTEIESEEERRDQQRDDDHAL
jgi:hypothetical protein